MKILFISDIHGITTNLKYIENLITENGFDKLIILGDIYSPYGDCIRVKEFIETYKDKVICVKGNCDSNIDLKQIITSKYLKSFDGNCFDYFTGLNDIEKVWNIIEYLKKIYK